MNLKKRPNLMMMTMMTDKDPDSFRKWLKINTDLSISSIELYVRTIRRYLESVKDITIESINRFISESFRESNSFYVKYAFQHYLKFTNREDMYGDLVTVKIGQKKKSGTYLSNEKIQLIIDSIRNEKYRDMARIQYAVGARPSEVIRIREEKISFPESDQDHIRIFLEGKGDRERTVYLHNRYRPVLEKYMSGGVGFLFLSEDLNLADEDDLYRPIQNMRTYMSAALADAARSVGIKKFGLHDFRRNFAEDLLDEEKDIRIVKESLGHSRTSTTMIYVSKKPEGVKDAFLNHQR